VESILDTNDLIQESSSLALETLNDMLTFDKMDEKKLVIEVDDLDVWSFVADNVRPFRLNALKNNVALSVDCMDKESNWMDEYRIKADKFKLNQVLRNFMSNALKFADSAHGEVKVVVERKAMSDKMAKASAMRGETAQDCVRVSVVDNGCGISAENQKRLFGQYVQFDASALQKGGGSGLGLWISKSLVELHGGLIGVKSEGVGRGSTFFFELPLFPKRAESAESRDSSIAVRNHSAISYSLPSNHEASNELHIQQLQQHQHNHQVPRIFPENHSSVISNTVAYVDKPFDVSSPDIESGEDSALATITASTITARIAIITSRLGHLASGLVNTFQRSEQYGATAAATVMSMLFSTNLCF